MFHKPRQRRFDIAKSSITRITGKAYFDKSPPPGAVDGERRPRAPYGVKTYMRTLCLLHSGSLPGEDPNSLSIAFAYYFVTITALTRPKGLPAHVRTHVRACVPISACQYPALAPSRFVYLEQHGIDTEDNFKTLKRRGR